MRFRVDVATDVDRLAWSDVHGPARAVLYALIKAQTPELASTLHDRGWAGSTVRPLGVAPPAFVGAPKVRGCYTTSARGGSLWLGSPVPEISGALLASLAGRRELRWGPVLLRVKGAQIESPPDFAGGEALLSSRTPVLIRYQDKFVLPDHPSFVDSLRHNLVHRADVLGLPSSVEIEVVDAGPMRHFEVAGRSRIGSTLRLRVAADPRTLVAFYEGGIGLLGTEGFGWLR